MSKVTNAHGGRRKGAGRPAFRAGWIKISTSLPKKLYIALDPKKIPGGSRPEYLAEALLERMKADALVPATFTY
jgi:hypothetical protein